jgi:transposase InsO family protein
MRKILGERGQSPRACMARRSDSITLIARLPGSDQAKTRATILLRVARNEITLEEGAAELGVSPQRVHELRETALTALVDACEPKPPGRRRTAPEATPPQGQTVQLSREIIEELARVRTEISLAFGSRLGGGKKNSVENTLPDERRYQRHIERLRNIEQRSMRERELRRDGARGPDAQAPCRRLEADIRRHACVVTRCAIGCGSELRSIADAIGVDSDTLRLWQTEIDERRQSGTEPRLLGAKPLDCPEPVAKRVRHQLALYGPGIGPATLKPDFPDISYRDLARISYRFRTGLRDSLRSCMYTACQWNVPGSVWAADYWEPDNPIDGIYRYVLDVRDLATGHVIASTPCERDDAATSVAVFEGLISAYRAPLVLKTDNGSHFTEGDFRTFLVRHGVVHLLSPIYMPQFNGSCEAGHGSIRARAEALARREGTPGRWSCNHQEAARVWNNRQTSDLRPHLRGRPLEESGNYS